MERNLFNKEYSEKNEENSIHGKTKDLKITSHKGLTPKIKKKLKLSNTEK